MDDTQPASGNSKTKLIVLVGALIVLAVGGLFVFRADDSLPPTTAETTTDPVGETTAPTSPPDNGAPAALAEDTAQTPPGDSTGSSNADAGEAAPNPVVVAPLPGQSVVAPSPGQYLDYQGSDQLSQLAGQDRWLNFHASWCPQCRRLDQDINANPDQIPSGVVILKVDFDDNGDLKRQYGVTQQTTIVRIDADGREVSRYVAFDEPTLANVIAGLD